MEKILYRLVGGVFVKPIVARLGERTSLLIGLGFGAFEFLLELLDPVLLEDEPEVVDSALGREPEGVILPEVLFVFGQIGRDGGEIDFEKFAAEEVVRRFVFAGGVEEEIVIENDFLDENRDRSDGLGGGEKLVQIALEEIPGEIIVFILLDDDGDGDHPGFLDQS